MKAVMIIGIVLLVLGAALMTFGYIEHRDTDPVVELGNIEITQTHTEKRRIPVAVSGTLLAVGAVLTIVGAVKRR